MKLSTDILAFRRRAIARATITAIAHQGTDAPWDAVNGTFEVFTDPADLLAELRSDWADVPGARELLEAHAAMLPAQRVNQEAPQKTTENVG